MTSNFVSVVNKVNNAAIRREKNARGDLVYVVPSYTLPDNVVMNGGLYPAEEIAKSYQTLEDTPAPAGHPADKNGNFITANSSDGILYYQCGIFNKNVRRESCEQYGNRVYVEKHIHVPTAMQTERGKRIIEAIDRNEPIHTSTGVLLNRVDQGGEGYDWVATNLSFDHDAILLDEEGAATPENGVGMLVNQSLVKEVSLDGKQFAANTAHLDTNQSFNDLREVLQTKIQKQYGDEETHLWLVDFGDDYVIFENGETAYKAAYMRDENNIMLDTEAQEVKRKTLWESVASGVKKVLTSPFVGLTSNKEGDDMSMKDMLKKRLGDKFEENMTDEEMLNAYAKTMKGNAAESSEGEQAAPEADTVDVQAMVNEAVEKALAANQEKQEGEKRTALVEELKTNGVELSENDAKSMSVNALELLAEKSKPVKSAFGLQGASQLNGNSDHGFADTLPE